MSDSGRPPTPLEDTPLPSGEDDPAVAGPKSATEAEAPQGFRGKLLRGVLVFVGLSALAFVILGKLVPGFWEAQTVSWRWPEFAGATALILPLWLLDALRYRVLARGFDLELGYLRCLQLGFLFHMAAYLTPGSAGGQPLVAWYLTRHGVPLPESLGISLIKPLLGMFVITFGGGIALLIHPAPPPGLERFLVLGAVLMLTLASGVGVLLLRPNSVARVCAWAFEQIARLPGLDRAGRFAGALDRSVEVAGRLRTRGLPFLAVNLALTIAWYAVGLIALGLVARSVGIGRPLHALSCDLGLFRALAIYAPTPGGAGLAEGGIAWLFGAERALALALGWRLLFHYAEIVAGLAVLVHTFKTPPRSPA
ncbi:MAG: flippase-like domain-containing protein [Planctomycetes bacterium]|nr:flippase-like domain-containing protein [Planctomycetota bacterium]